MHKAADPLKPHPDDALITVGRAVVAAVPLAGGSILELLGPHPAQKRRDELLRGLNAKVAALEVAGKLSLAELKDDEEFQAAVIRGVQAASRELEKEKIEFLRNAILHVALHQQVETSVNSLVMSLIEAITVTHIKMIRSLCDDVRKIWPSEVDPVGKELDLQSFVSAFIPRRESPADCKEPVKTLDGYFDQRELNFTMAIARDLESRRLVAIGLQLPKSAYNWSTNPSENGREMIFLTHLGAMLLDAIEDPEQGTAAAQPA